MGFKQRESLYWKIAKKSHFVYWECAAYQNRHPRTFLRKWRFLLQTSLKYRRWKNGYEDKGWRELHEEEMQTFISRYEVISFDIFDTLLNRKFNRPTDVFAEVEDRSGVLGFKKERICAEQMAREHHSDREDVTLEEIYAELPEKYRRLREKELEMERTCTQAIVKARAVYEAARTEGKRLVICSDMYLPGNFLGELLHEKGYEGFEYCFVSSDIGKTKATGTLFAHMISELRTTPERILHIGDNFWADGEAVKAGMGFIHVIGDRFFFYDRGELAPWTGNI